MARNPNVTKAKLQKFRKRRGAYASHSEASTLDPGFNNPALQQFWAERIAPRPRGGGQSRVNRGDVPLSGMGYVDYRGHAKTLGQDDRRYDLTPQRAAFLNTIMPGVKLVSDNRQQVIQLISALMQELPADEYFASVVVERTRFEITRMFYNGTKTCLFFVKQDVHLYHGSITYGSADRAKEVYRSGTIRWKTARTCIINSPDDGVNSS